MLSRLKKFYRKILHYPFKYYNRKRIKNKKFTLISKDCTGGMLLSELGLRLDTPTINACFHAGDFVKFCANLRYYLSHDMVENKENSLKMGYPVGILGDYSKEVRVWFMHYENFSYAKAKWKERSSRVHWDNIFIIMTDGKGCNEEIAQEFDLLPYEHKALLTYRELENLNN